MDIYAMLDSIDMLACDNKTNSLCLVEQCVNFRPFLYNLGPTSPIPVNIKHLLSICTMLGKRRRRWAGVVQVLRRCFVFTRIVPHLSSRNFN